MEYKIEYATINELNSWMDLVRLVAWNFPGLETESLLDEYKNTVIKNINRKVLYVLSAGIRLLEFYYFLLSIICYAAWRYILITVKMA